MVKIGKNAGINTLAILTNMDIPLGNNIGNALEVQEAVDVLKCKGPKDLTEICIRLATYMNAITNNLDIQTSLNQVMEVLQSGKAYNKFLELVNNQGGNLESIYKQPLYKYEVYSETEGYIASMDTANIGKISGLLGAGRLTKEDNIDYTAGIVLNKKTSDYVKKGEILATFYSSKVNEFSSLEQEYKNSLSFSLENVTYDLVIDVVG